MSTTRIPVKQADFNTYIMELSIYLFFVLSGGMKRGEFLGMVANELTKFTAYVLKWSNPSPDDLGIWLLHSNSQTKNTYTRAQVKEFMKEFSGWFNPILTRMSVSENIKPEDRVVLHIAEPDTPYSHITEPIAEKCYVTCTMLGGGQVKLRGKTTTDASRASKPPRSDAMEIALRIDLPYIAAEAGNETASKLKSPLAHANDGTTKSIHSKASPTLNLGEENVGNMLQFFSRWINTKHPDLAGPWTGPRAESIG